MISASPLRIVLGRLQNAVKCFQIFTKKKRKILSDNFSKDTTDTTAVSTVLPSVHKFLI